jgi:diguanylate cyclase (GGDEF)-like protein
MNPMKRGRRPQNPAPRGGGAHPCAWHRAAAGRGTPGPYPEPGAPNPFRSEKVDRPFQFRRAAAEGLFVQQDEAPRRAPLDRTPADDAPGDVAVPPTDGMRPAPPPPRARLRPLTRRAHERVPGATAARLERQAFGATGHPQPIAAAVSILPGASMPAAVTPLAGGADLDVLLGDEELGCAPGRHRRPSPFWALLQYLPGFRSVDPASWDDVEDEDHEADEAKDAGTVASDAAAELDDADAAAADADADDPDADADDPDADANEGFEDEFDDAFDEVDGAGTRPGEPELADLRREPSASRRPEPIEAYVPPPRSQSDEEPELGRRRPGASPAVRAGLRAAARRIEEAPDPATIARVACEEAARLVEADVTAFVLRSVEGPRVLWLHPGGPDADGLWGPATLAALLRVAQPVRRVVEGDPLAGGAATALLSMPVPSGGAVAGSLLARRHDEHVFTAGEQDVLGRIARMAGAALRAASRPAARGALDDDPVTGLPLARRFTADVEAAIRASQRQAIPVSLVAAHVDGLGRVRTDLGGPIADEVLQTLATALGAVLRVGDLAYRIGPDEFAVLLPATDATGLPQVLSRLEAVAAETFDQLALPGARRPLALRTSPVPTDELAVLGGSVVDATLKALELDRQKVRWAPTR